MRTILEHHAKEIRRDTIRSPSNNLIIYCVCSALFLLIFATDLFIPLGVAAGVPYILPVLFSLWIPDRKFTIKVALAGSVLTVFGLLYSPMGGELWKVLFNRGLALFAVWTTALLTLQRKRVEEERFRALKEKKRLKEEAKILKGLLPICASCKKIRDDNGYWNRIEAYIEARSEAQFSHGLCKECQDKLYGNEPWYHKNEKT